MNLDLDRPAAARSSPATASIARVVSINAGNFYRPRLEILRNGAGKKMAGSVVDLADSPFLHITGPLPEGALRDPEEASR